MAAIALLERAVLHAGRYEPRMPGWLIGRLATYYRSAKRYADEVHLLERYVATEDWNGPLGRFAARLSKARAMAEKRGEVHTNGASASVRHMLRRRRTNIVAAQPATVDEDRA